MPATFRLTLAQLNPTLGAIEANAALAQRAWEEGRMAGAQMVALTEMFITGYQTQDLILKPAFVAHAIAAIEALATATADGPALGHRRPASAQWPALQWLLCAGRRPHRRRGAETRIAQ